MDWLQIGIGLKMDWHLMVDGLVRFVLRRDTSVGLYSKLVPLPLTELSSADEDWHGCVDACQSRFRLGWG